MQDGRGGEQVQTGQLDTAAARTGRCGGPLHARVGRVRGLGDQWVGAPTRPGRFRAGGRRRGDAWPRGRWAACRQQHRPPPGSSLGPPRRWGAGHCGNVSLLRIFLHLYFNGGDRAPAGDTPGAEKITKKKRRHARRRKKNKKNQPQPDCEERRQANVGGMEPSHATRGKHTHKAQ